MVFVLFLEVKEIHTSSITVYNKGQLKAEQSLGDKHSSTWISKSLCKVIIFTVFHLSVSLLELTSCQHTAALNAFHVHSLPRLQVQTTVSNTNNMMGKWLDDDPHAEIEVIMWGIFLIIVIRRRSKILLRQPVTELSLSTCGGSGGVRNTF